MRIDIPADRVAVVCGGTAAIGECIALRLAQSGCRRVVVCGRSVARGADTLARLTSACANAEFHFVQCDIAEPGGVDAMFESIATRVGEFDIYVHCVPPGGAGGRLGVADRLRFRQSLSNGLGALADACARACDVLRKRGGGAIVLFASDAGRTASPGHSLIGVVQSGIISLTRSLALEVAQDKIRVNGISPSYVLGTPLVDRLRSTAASKAIDAAERRAGLGLPTPDDIAPLAAFLASPLAARITGQVVSINGGLGAY